MQKYKNHFSEEHRSIYEVTGDCGDKCMECSELEVCKKSPLQFRKQEQCELREECPVTANPRGGKCAKADNSGYLKGVCDKGYHWDKVKEVCVKVTK